MSGILQRISNSLKYRTFYGYCDGLKFLKSPHVKLKCWEPVDKTLPRLVVIVYHRDIPLLIKSLQSLAHHHMVLPPLSLIGDSDAAFATLKELLPESSENVQIRHWQEDLVTLLQEEQHFIRTWLNSGKWGGYAKKFAITLANSRNDKILLSDADVLWSGTFLADQRAKSRFGPQILIGMDYARAYDTELAHFLGEEKILSCLPINCGFVYYPKGILDQVFSQMDYERLTTWAARATCHFEQTLIAFAFWKTDGQFFAPDEVVTTIVDNFCYGKKTRGLVRHYAGCKHLFWRDV